MFRYKEVIRQETIIMEIWKEKLGTANPEYINSINTLTNCLLELPDYPEAIRFATEALNAAKNVYGINNMHYVEALFNISSYYKKIGNISEYLNFESEAIKIWGNKLDMKNHRYILSLEQLADDYFNNGLHAEAIQLRKEAIEVSKKLYGTTSFVHSSALKGLAEYYVDIRRYQKAIRLSKESAEIDRIMYGPDNHLYAYTLSWLAHIYYCMGNYNEAIRLNTNALKICLEMDFQKILRKKALYYFKVGNYDEALRLKTEDVNIEDSTMCDISIGSIRKKYWKDRKMIFTEEYPKYVYMIQSPEAIDNLYDKSALFAKGFLLQTDIEARKLILESGDTMALAKYEELTGSLSMYNKLIEKPIKERYMDADSLHYVIVEQEKELMKMSEAYGDMMRNLKLTWRDVEQKLGKEDIALEFLDFPLTEDSTMYIALALKQGYDHPHLVTLFEKKQLDAIPDSTYYESDAMYRLVWEPLGEELKGVKNIYFAPSGELHRIGIEYLPDTEERPMQERYNLYRLSSTRQIVMGEPAENGKWVIPVSRMFAAAGILGLLCLGGISAKRRKWGKAEWASLVVCLLAGTAAILCQRRQFAFAHGGHGGIVYGGLDYNAQMSVPLDTMKEDVYVDRASVDSLRLGGKVNYLPGTKKESIRIAGRMKRRLIPCTYYSDTLGTEETFKHLDGGKNALLHIATHGFYLAEETTKREDIRTQLVMMMGEDRPKYSEDKAMTRSGLLLAGCNHALKHEPIPETAEDGILTAEEIASLDLRGMELVALSACQTGLGEITSGEGVFGLQRGFKNAGVKSILMSLWKVDDQATAILMDEFYKNYLSGKSKQESLLEAQRHLREYKNGVYASPRYWAAFILLDGL